MSEDYQKLLAQVREMQRQMSDTFQVGTVHEVKGTKVRLSMGKGQDGQPHLTPWLNTANHRGGAREQRFYKKGQTLQMIAPGGDLAQASLAPFAPNKTFKTPEHADGSGQDEESYQLDDYRTKQTKEGHDMWLQPEQQEQQQQGGQQGGQKQQKKGHVGGASAVMKTRMNNGGGITHRVGKEVRIAAHKEGSKLRAGSNAVIATTKRIIFTTPPVLGRDPIPNDDK
jgi:hypothetical protein